MFITTSGIVLRVYPFRDKKLIAKIFTKKAGLISCIITKNKLQLPLSQILTMAEITYKNSKQQTLLYLKDVQINYVYNSLSTNTTKIQVSMVLCEILNKCVNEPSIFIYEFIISSFKYLDNTPIYNVGFDTLFLIKFCGILGISPFNTEVSEIDNAVLSIDQGQFIQNPNTIKNNSLIPKKESYALYQLSKLNFNSLPSYKITADVNLKLFNYMIIYISTHLTDLTKLKSIRVLKELG